MIHWRHFPEQGHSEVTVVTWDRDYLFARVTGAFAATNLTILKADIFTRADDIAIETFYVATDKLEPVTDERDRAAFEKILFQAMGMEPVRLRRRPSPEAAAKAARPSTTRPRRFPTQGLGRPATPRAPTPCSTSRPPIIPACSYRIASAIADTGLSLVTARITTEKGAALDTFYLCDKNGKKIESDDDAAKNLTREVRERIAL